MTRTNKPWHELAIWQKIAVAILGAAQFMLLGAALWDLRQRSPQEINGSKQVWTVISFINFIGPVSYFLLGIKRQPGQAWPCSGIAKPRSSGR
jgi:hypothetical protein